MGKPQNVTLNIDCFRGTAPKTKTVPSQPHNVNISDFENKNGNVLIYRARPRRVFGAEYYSHHFVNMMLYRTRTCSTVDVQCTLVGGLALEQPSASTILTFIGTQHGRAFRDLPMRGQGKPVPRPTVLMSIGRLFFASSCFPPVYVAFLPPNSRIGQAPQDRLPSRCVPLQENPRTVVTGRRPGWLKNGIGSC